ncbi:MAG: EthD family reductase [Bacteroidota bacterium]
MYKLTALFKHPSNVEEFDTHYNEVHAPLMRKVPGLQKLLVSRNLRSFGAESPYYLIAEMHFPDRETFKTAMASDENKAAGKDVMGFAGDLVTMVHGEFQEVEG